MQIRIAGRSYPVKTALPPDFVTRLESHIESKYARLASSGGARTGGSLERDLVLLLINVANDYLEAEDRVDMLKKEMILKIDALINKIDKAL